MSRYEYTDIAGYILAAGWTGTTYYARKAKLPLGSGVSQGTAETAPFRDITDIGELLNECRKLTIELPPNVMFQLIEDKYRPGENDPFAVNLQGWKCVESEPVNAEMAQEPAVFAICPKCDKSLRVGSIIRFGVNGPEHSDCIDRKPEGRCSVCLGTPCCGLHPKTLFRDPNVFEVNYPDGIAVYIYRDDDETVDVDLYRLGKFLANMRLPL